MPDQKDLAAKVLDLKAEVERAKTARATADAQLTMAKQQLDKIDAQLRALGVEPEQAEQTLRLLEEQLHRKVDELQATVSQEVNAYNTVIQMAKGAFA